MQRRSRRDKNANKARLGAATTLETVQRSQMQCWGGFQCCLQRPGVRLPPAGTLQRECEVTQISSQNCTACPKAADMSHVVRKGSQQIAENREPVHNVDSSSGCRLPHRLARNGRPENLCGPAFLCRPDIFCVGGIAPKEHRNLCSVKPATPPRWQL